MQTRIQELVADLRPQRPSSTLLYRGAGFWLLVGVFHAAVLVATGWEWSGSVSFRKPLTFSVSTGLLLATVGWILDRLPNRPRLASSIAWTFLVSTSAEVGLITLQAWRGRASHFNVLDDGDAAIFGAMGVLVGLMSLCLIGVLVWAVLVRPQDRLVRLAVIGGMALVTTGLGIGQWIIELGNGFVAAHDAVPDTVVAGEAGVVKFPHAVAFHGIQVFIVAAVALRHSHRASGWQRRMLRTIVCAYTAVLAFAMAQTIAGHPPLDASVWGFGFGAAVTTLGIALIRVARAWWTAAEAPAPLGVPVA